MSKSRSTRAAKEPTISEPLYVEDLTVIARESPQVRSGATPTARLEAALVRCALNHIAQGPALALATSLDAVVLADSMDQALSAATEAVPSQADRVQALQYAATTRAAWRWLHAECAIHAFASLHEKARAQRIQLLAATHPSEEFLTALHAKDAEVRSRFQDIRCGAQLGGRVK